MKKKIVSILLVATMIVAASSACGKEKHLMIPKNCGNGKGIER